MTDTARTSQSTCMASLLEPLVPIVLFSTCGHKPDGSEGSTAAFTATRHDGQVPSYSDKLSFLLLNNRGKTRGQDKRRNKEAEKDWVASKWPATTSCRVPGGFKQSDR
ncbi:hypothetical protein EYF80_041574 [Liparis tanakae]|uniref:Uncharacterized protein n=1 Tax=Liparis tanakae TaxID=230148 RepID=A0A4Z2G557_9TELE|nr:hypothetical protein EYF80_041574 [Liparis tanakae]